jgi:nitrite reductase/ring-hydroxylating ferredoxin subunit
MDEGFERVAETSEIPAGSIRIFKIADQEVMVANIENSFYALPNKCTHQGGPIGRGRLTGSIVQCPWHGSRFDVKTGAVVGGPAVKPETPLQVKLENSTIWIKK